MKQLIILLIFVLGFNFFSNAQSNINDYKYVIVPNNYNFLKEVDQHRLNSLTKFLFNKYGFTAFMDNEDWPEDFANNRCLALNADVKKLKGFLKTKLVIVLKNCENDIVFTSKVGQTKEKDFAKAYNFALRDAFKSIEVINYSYKPNDNIIAKSNQEKPSGNQEIERLKEEIKTLKDEKLEVVESTPNIVEEVKKVEVEKPILTTTKMDKTLYAQETKNGFQVVDAIPKVVMLLITTPKQDTFIVKGKDAIVYKEDGFWYLSENDGNTTITKTINIKF